MVLAMAAKHPEVLVRLDGAGDDFRIIGQVTKAMRRAGIAEQEIETFCDEAISGHDHDLLRICGRWITLAPLGVSCARGDPNEDTAAMTSRRFPAPWRADKMPGGYVVRDANGQALVYLYSRESEAEAMQAKVLTADEARRIAINVAKLPGLLGRGN